ncbi:MAG: AglZ/HisF2 family acetamidino modification protein [Candidatus Bathyarchaeota archaeon]|nr:AglZ/HisF2 family acetamidino modification protein [Candidatus Bathyarchaeota archaeon]
MIKTRVIPCLLLKNHGFYKTIDFKNPRYLGDPINIVKLFNDKEAYELAILDITATVEGKEPDFNYLAEIASECFMPIGYGGGIRNVQDIQRLLSIGFEKVIINTEAVRQPELIKKSSNQFGAQSIVVSIDVKKEGNGKHVVYINGGRERTGLDPVEHAKNMERNGAGEILLTSIDRDGMMNGYDLDLIRMVSNSVGIPLLACGGAGRIEHFGEAVKSGASAVVAGSLFVYYGKHKAVLVNFPETRKLEEQLI